MPVERVATLSVPMDINNNRKGYKTEEEVKILRPGFPYLGQEHKCGP